MSFAEQGFLAPPEAKHRTELAKFGEQLDLALQINAIAMRLVWSLEVPPRRKDLAVGGLLFIRAVRSYQTSLVLLQQGLSVEAQSMCRQIIECVLRIAKLAQQPSFVEHMEGESQRHRITQAEKLVDIEKDPDLVARYRELAAMPKPEGAVHYEQLARDVGLEPLYHALYRGTSGFAAHATLGALAGQVQQSEDGVNFSFARQYGPVADHALAMIIPLGIESIHQIAIQFKLDWPEAEAIRVSAIWQAMCRARPELMQG